MVSHTMLVRGTDLGALAAVTGAASHLLPEMITLVPALLGGVWYAIMIFEWFRGRKPPSA